MLFRLVLGRFARLPLFFSLRKAKSYWWSAGWYAWTFGNACRQTPLFWSKYYGPHCQAIYHEVTMFLNVSYTSYLFINSICACFFHNSFLGAFSKMTSSKTRLPKVVWCVCRRLGDWCLGRRSPWRRLWFAGSLVLSLKRLALGLGRMVYRSQAPQRFTYFRSNVRFSRNTLIDYKLERSKPISQYNP